jgi:hypothetical protein
MSLILGAALVRQSTCVRRRVGLCWLVAILLICVRVDDALLVSGEEQHQRISGKCC